MHGYDSEPGAEAIRVGAGTRVAIYDAETNADSTDALEAAGTLVYAESDGALDALDDVFSTFKDWTNLALVALDL